MYLGCYTLIVYKCTTLSTVVRDKYKLSDVKLIMERICMNVDGCPCQMSQESRQAVGFNFMDDCRCGHGFHLHRRLVSEGNFT